MKSNNRVIEKLTIPTKTLYEELQVSAWVPVYIAINYKTMTLSLIERDGSNKNRLFAGRGTSYEQWRSSILESMKAAMDLGFEKLREREKENEEVILTKAASLMLAMEDIK